MDFSIKLVNLFRKPGEKLNSIGYSLVFKIMVISYSILLISEKYAFVVGFNAKNITLNICIYLHNVMVVFT